ncbi:type I methionyl aminopeptidase [Ornithinimicrobium sp. Y1847]|uniref:type I methionyl aminopeptidase n=1 Tax=unclassified Ornithinimicrobium TaxID=2615080 RepID=UPI003B670A53
MIELRTPTEIEQMRPAGEFVAGVLHQLREWTEVGTNLLDIDAEARRMIAERGATSCYVDYAPSFGRGPFGKVICTSINDAVLHGLPHDYALRDGDLVSLDFAVSVDGWVADSAVSFVVGTPREEDLALIATTEKALAAGIAAARADARLGDISHAIGQVCRRDGHRVNLEFGGHGVGREMHGDPHVLNDGRPGKGMRLRPGLVIAIEPWLMLGTAKLDVDEDGWTLRSQNGRRGAHSEHTIAVTEGDPIVLTARQS